MVELRGREGVEKGREGVTRIEEARREPKREEEKERGRRGDKGGIVR